MSWARELMLMSAPTSEALTWPRSQMSPSLLSVMPPSVPAAASSQEAVVRLNLAVASDQIELLPDMPMPTPRVSGAPLTVIRPVAHSLPPTVVLPRTKPEPARTSMVAFLPVQLDVWVMLL